MARQGGNPYGGGFLAGWRGLGRFWLLIVVLLAIGGGVLQWFGAPGQPEPVKTPPAAPLNNAEPAAFQPAKAGSGAVEVRKDTDRASRPGRDTPGPVADPDPALLEQDPADEAHPLPRIAADGRMPMQTYAAGFDSTTSRPRVGLIVAGIGGMTADSAAAVQSLQGAVTFAISPYESNLGKLLNSIRSSEHEYLVSVPMEPREFPLNDPGPEALMTNLPSKDNLKRLHWILSRFSGYVGATDALNSLRGERFAAQADQMEAMLGELSERGLLFVDVRPGINALPKAWGRSVDLVIDDPPTEAGIDAKLAQLAKLAKDSGSALGLATGPRPVTVARIVAWTNGLAEQGLILAPVSALAHPPAADAAQ
jgi:hypothetical protein